MSTAFRWMYAFSSLFSQCHGVTLSDWTLSNAIFPSPTYRAICGYNSVTQKLLILGGSDNSYNLMSYDLSCNNITVHSPLSLSFDCNSQCFTQYGENIYFVNNHQMGIFNMDSHEIQHPVSPNLIARGWSTCLTPSEDGRYIFIVGGKTSNNGMITIFQIFDTQTQTITNGPQMGASQCCSEPSCMVKNNRLWWFGGYQRYVGTYSGAAYIDVSNITNIGSWTPVSPMTEPRGGQQNVIYNGLMYIIGGFGADGGSHTLVEQYDVDTFQSNVDTPLPVGAEFQCVFDAGERLFVTVNNNLYWTNAIGATLTPTNYMACDPTKQPTLRPTANPTSPTKQPTSSPSSQPTATATNPTFDPTTDSTDDPIHHHIIAIKSTLYSYFNRTTITNSVSIESVNTASPTNKAMVTAVVIIASVFISLLCVAVLVKFFHKNKMKSKNDEKQLHELRSADNAQTTTRDTNPSPGVNEEVNPNEMNTNTANESRELSDNRCEGQQIVLATEYVRQYTECVQCGDKTQQKMTEVDGILMCYTCRRLNRKDVDKEVDEMFTSNTNTPDETAEQETVGGISTTKGIDSRQCTDCGLVKSGKLYEGDGLFYCDECYNWYTSDKY